MALLTYRANLASATFPLVSTLFGRTVIVGGQDQNFVRQLYSPEDPDKDIGVPQSYYLHNVLPTTQGYAAIGYELQSGGASSLTSINDSHILFGTDGAKAYIGTSDQGIVVYQLPSRVYTLLLALVAPYNSAQVTTAIIAGKTYFYVSGYGCYTYEPTTGVLTPVTLTGLTASAVLGICAANGYMIAFTEETVLWSSTIDPTDFVPSLLTGAGGGSVENLKGQIITVVPTNTGLMICSNTNIVATIYTGNSRYPYQFVEVTGSGGVTSHELVAYDTNTGNNFAYTSYGLQLINSNRAALVFPEVTDFLAGQIFEDYNETTHEFTVTNLPNALAKKINLISARYLVISYGISSLTHALVYDLAERRWGKLKITHSDCFEYQLLDQVVSDIPKKSIAFVTSEGLVSTVNSDQKSASRNGVIMFGKFQYVRSRNLSLERVVVETQSPDFGISLRAYGSYDGKSVGITKVPSAMYSGPLSKEWMVHTDALNHSLLFQGAFSLNTLILEFFPTGHTRMVRV